MLKRLLLLSMMLLLFGFAFAVRDVSSSVARVIEESDAILADDDGGGGDTPTDPAHAMEEAVNIYIHVILQRPAGPPPPDEFEILSVDTVAQVVLFKTPTGPEGYGGINFFLYREFKWPMLYKAHVDTADFIGRSSEMWLRDEFTDAFWPIPANGGTKGIWDTNVNYFWVATTVDSNSATGEVTESAYPSPCVCEYDQFFTKARTGGGQLIGSRNIVTYPNAHSYDDFIDIGRAIPGTTQFYVWLATTQSWVLAATKVGASWIPTPGRNHVQPGEVFAVNLGAAGNACDPRYAADTSRFTTCVPGIIAPDTQYVFIKGTAAGLGWNWIMLPMKYTTILRDANRPQALGLKHVGADIGAPCTEIRVWSQNGQTMVQGAFIVAGNWMGSQLAWPGRAIAVGVNANATDLWPPVLIH